jgi:hypothetical protein
MALKWSDLKKCARCGERKDRDKDFYVRAVHCKKCEANEDLVRTANGCNNNAVTGIMTKAITYMAKEMELMREEIAKLREVVEKNGADLSDDGPKFKSSDELEDLVKKPTKKNITVVDPRVAKILEKKKFRSDKCY